MRLLPIAWAAAAVLSATVLSVAGCGGDGPAVPAPTTREALRSSVLGAFAARSANAGLESMLGLGGRFSPLGREARNGDPDVGGGGGVPSDETYFDDWLGLWAVSRWTETSSTIEYFEDEGLTRAAGYSRSSWTVDGDVSRATSRLRIDFGPSAGYRLETDSETNLATGAGSYSSRTVHPEFGSGEDEGRWSADGSGAYRSRWTRDGRTETHEGTYAADGSWTSAMEAGDGFGLTLAGAADGSGTGRMTGPSPLLPAAIAWTADGRGTITRADGVVEDLGWFGLGGGGVVDDPGDGDPGVDGGGTDGGLDDGSTGGSTGGDGGP